MPKLALSDRELATVLAALRFWQLQGGTCLEEPEKLDPHYLERPFDDDYLLSLEDQYRQIGEIACDAGDPLTVEEIDELCERLNVGKGGDKP